MQRRLTSSAALLLILLALGACASTSAKGGVDQQLRVPENQIVLEVENHSWNNIKISVIRGGNDVRLGTVDALSTETFTIPESVAAGSDVRLQAVPTTATTRSDGLLSGPIMLAAGQKIGWRLDSSPGKSEGPTRGHVVLP